MRLNHYALDHFRARPDEAVVLNDGRICLQWLKYPTDADAPGQVHVFADLRAGTHGCPGVDHRTLVDIGANVDERGHQNHIARDVTAPARNSGRNHAKAALRKTLGIVVNKLRGHFVIKLHGTRRHRLIVLQAKRQQDRFLDPLVNLPLPFVLLSDPQATRIKFFKYMLNSLS